MTNVNVKWEKSERRMVKMHIGGDFGPTKKKVK